MSDEKKYNWFSTMPLIEKAGKRFISSTRLKKRKNRSWFIFWWLLIISLCINMWILIINWLGW